MEIHVSWGKGLFSGVLARRLVPFSAEAIAPTASPASYRIRAAAGFKWAVLARQAPYGGTQREIKVKRPTRLDPVCWPAAHIWRLYCLAAAAAFARPRPVPPAPRQPLHGVIRDPTRTRSPSYILSTRAWRLLDRRAASAAAHRRAQSSARACASPLKTRGPRGSWFSIRVSNMAF